MANGYSNGGYSNGGYSNGNNTGYGNNSNSGFNGYNNNNGFGNGYNQFPEQRKVEFGEAVTRGFENYVNFSGRASRSEYWWWALFNFIVGVAAYLIFGEDSIISNLISLAFLLPSLGLGVRRLHDIGKSGWWLLLAFVPLANILLIVWFCQPSEPQTNEYGPVPNLV